MTLAEKLEITKKPKDDLKLVVQKKVLVKISDWHGFLMKTSKYSTTIEYGVTKILQEGKPFQINIIF